MTMIEIHADMREQRCGLVDLIKKRADVNVLDVALPIGDFSVGGGIIIERKTAKDFLGSIIDGRFHEQVLKMKLNYSKPVVILESDIYSTRSKFSLQALGGALAWMAAQGVNIIPAPGIEATAEIIYFMAKNAQVEMKDVPMRSKNLPSLNITPDSFLRGCLLLARHKPRGCLSILVPCKECLPPRLKSFQWSAGSARLQPKGCIKSSAGSSARTFFGCHNAFRGVFNHQGGNEIISEAEAKSAKTCATCWKPGTLVRGSWIRVGCDDHLVPP